MFKRFALNIVRLRKESMVFKIICLSVILVIILTPFYYLVGVALLAEILFEKKINLWYEKNIDYYTH